MGGAKFATKNENKSLGFNLAWEASDRLGLQLDYHDSSAESGADSPYGSNAVLGVAGFLRGTTTADFSQRLPGHQRGAAGWTDRHRPVADDGHRLGFRNSYMKTDIEQTQLSGNFDFSDSSRLDFGVGPDGREEPLRRSRTCSTTPGAPTSRSTRRRSRTTSGAPIRSASTSTRSPAAATRTCSTTSSRSTSTRARNIAAGLRGDGPLQRQRRTSRPIGTSRKNRRAPIVQFSQACDTAMPIHAAVGVRYEKTDVTSSALVPSPTGISWAADNEFNVVIAGRSFHHHDPEGRLRLRAAEPRLRRRAHGQPEAARQLGQEHRPSGLGRHPGRPDARPAGAHQRRHRLAGQSGAEAAGVDQLRPVARVVLRRGSYASVGYFSKDIDNYIGVTQIVEQPFDLHTPIGGALYNEAVAAACADRNTTCIRNCIFDNHRRRSGRGRGSRQLAPSPAGRRSDRDFRITVPANQRSATLDGLEFNVQHMFGDTGFGVSANYTLVDSGLKYDNHLRNEQFALEGLSDAANLVGVLRELRLGGARGLQLARRVPGEPLRRRRRRTRCTPSPTASST